MPSCCMDQIIVASIRWKEILFYIQMVTSIFLDVIPLIKFAAKPQSRLEFDKLMISAGLVVPDGELQL